MRAVSRCITLIIERTRLQTYLISPYRLCSPLFPSFDALVPFPFGLLRLPVTRFSVYPRPRPAGLH